MNLKPKWVKELLKDVDFDIITFEEAVNDEKLYEKTKDYYMLEEMFMYISIKPDQELKDLLFKMMCKEMTGDGEYIEKMYRHCFDL